MSGRRWVLTRHIYDVALGEYRCTVFNVSTSLLQLLTIAQSTQGFAIAHLRSVR